MQTCFAKASAAIVQHVPRAAVEEFKDWQRGVTAAVESFPGYEGSDLYPPADSQGDEWVAVIHFENDASLQAWLDSSVRKRWVENLQSGVGEFEVKRLSGGFSQWFTGVGRNARHAPPGWKMALTVLCALYPTVLLLSIFVGPYTRPLGLAFSMLIANALSVSILQWFVMPALNRVLAPWLTANDLERKWLNYLGLAGIVAVLATIAIVVRQFTG
jgi:uncharacterized protein